MAVVTIGTEFVVLDDVADLRDKAAGVLSANEPRLRSRSKRKSPLDILTANRSSNLFGRAIYQWSIPNTWVANHAKTKVGFGPTGSSALAELVVELCAGLRIDSSASYRAALLFLEYRDCQFVKRLRLSALVQ